MQIGTRRVACALLVGLTGVAASLGLRADAAQQSEIAEIQLQLANELYAEGRYAELYRTQFAHQPESAVMDRCVDSCDQAPLASAAGTAH